MRCEVRHEPPRDPGPAWLQVAGMLLPHVESPILSAVQNLPEAGLKFAAVRAATPGALLVSVRPGIGTSSRVSPGLPSSGTPSRIPSGTLPRVSRRERVRTFSAAAIVRSAVASSRRWHRRRAAGLKSALSYAPAAQLVGRLSLEQICERCAFRLTRWIARSTIAGSARRETAWPRAIPSMDRRGDQENLAVTRLQVLPCAHEGVPPAKYQGNYRSFARSTIGRREGRLINLDSPWHDTLLRFPSNHLYKYWNIPLTYVRYIIILSRDRSWEVNWILYIYIFFYFLFFHVTFENLLYNVSIYFSRNARKIDKIWMELIKLDLYNCLVINFFFTICQNIFHMVSWCENLIFPSFCRITCCTWNKVDYFNILHWLHWLIFECNFTFYLFLYFNSFNRRSL